MKKSVNKLGVIGVPGQQENIHVTIPVKNLPKDKAKAIKKIQDQHDNKVQKMSAKHYVKMDVLSSDRAQKILAMLTSSAEQKFISDSLKTKK